MKSEAEFVCALKKERRMMQRQQLLKQLWRLQNTQPDHATAETNNVATNNVAKKDAKDSSDNGVHTASAADGLSP